VARNPASAPATSAAQKAAPARIPALIRKPPVAIGNTALSQDNWEEF